MESPLALKILKKNSTDIHNVSIPIAVATQIKRYNASYSPAIVVANTATVLGELSTSIVDLTNIRLVVEGDWNNALLIVLNEQPPQIKEATAKPNGDDAFLTKVMQDAPHLTELAKRTLSLIRESGVEGELEEANGRWVNRPINTFTLKIQKRVGNLQFTLYGNPQSFPSEMTAGDDFVLRQDQNSYSRGWIKKTSDANKLAQLVKLSHSRRAPN